MSFIPFVCLFSLTVLIKKLSMDLWVTPNMIHIWSKFFLPVSKSLPSWDRAKSHLHKSINYWNKINLEHFLKYIFWREFHRLNPDIVLDPGILCVLWREFLALAEVCRVRLLVIYFSEKFQTLLLWTSLYCAGFTLHLFSSSKSQRL